MIKRKILKDLVKNLSTKDIALIVGSRQVGKTTVMQWLRDYLLERGEKTVFFNLDYDHDKIFFKSHDVFLTKLRLEVGKNKAFVFIDEIQRKENAGLFLKGLYDLNLPYKLIVSGSGSLELKEMIHESLAGRKRIFEMSPVNFEEFVDFKTDYKYEDRLDDYFAVEHEKISLLLVEYMMFGGYPRVILNESLSEKFQIIADIARSYLDKDIAYLLKMNDTEIFSKMISLIASQTGQLMNYSELAGLCGIAMQTVKKYLWYAEKTFIIYASKPYFKNSRKEITKSPMYYFEDHGFYNYVLSTYGQPIDESRIGFIFQNFIANILKAIFAHKGVNLHFWRTKDMAEVDFVVFGGDGVVPVEVKYCKMAKPKVERSLNNFISKYKPKKAIIVNLTLNVERKIENTMVKWIPFWKLKDEFGQ